MKKIFYIFLMLSCFATMKANAQQRFFSLQYSIGFGSSDVKDFIGSASFRGVSMEYREMVTPQIGIGAELGWNVFYERRAYASYTKDSQTITGVQYRYINAMPMLAAFDYYFKPEEKINPFIGLGVGTLYTKRNTDMNLYTIEEDVWQFALRPEAGIRVNASDNMDFILVGKYFNGFKTSNSDSQSYFTFNIGMVFK